ncbi:MAG: methylated-DNA--[protein]-cysteine S-methyltransferase [Pseudomonadota bacterium]|nr:methylated-DNA--[protein]-cysteine S-methyltransferase [Pseudomonadota bacterium]
MKTLPVVAHTVLPTPLGDVRLAATARGVCGAWFVTQQRHAPEAAAVAAWPAPEPAGQIRHPALAAAAQQLGRYFQGQGQEGFALPLDLSAGTAFQQAVWQALLGIGPSQAQSYAEVAARMGRPAAVRAVGLAVGANPISIIVPCHRVLGAGGQLTGFGGGLARKVALLRHEGWRIDLPAGQAPTRTLRAWPARSQGQQLAFWGMDT